MVESKEDVGCCYPALPTPLNASITFLLCPYWRYAAMSFCIGVGSGSPRCFQMRNRKYLKSFRRSSMSCVCIIQVVPLFLHMSEERVLRLVRICF